ncbi:MAG TPA: hypothetical protein VNO70_23035, partial [Blastocatellia bacterium]|nr:hypothetical protein [Blastocatellia bacterium]
MRAYTPSRNSSSRNVTAIPMKRAHCQGFHRKAICLSLLLTLLVSPAPGFILRDLPQFAAHAVAFASSEARKLPDFFKSWLGKPAAISRQETLADRTARVAAIRISPPKFVGYLDETQTFSAIGLDAAGEIVEGVRFSWESSDADKLTVDEGGAAAFLKPGQVRLTCRAGAAQAEAVVLIRPARRRPQTDEEWKADQDSLQVSDSTVGAARLLPSLLDKLSPTAQAQGGTGTDMGVSACTGCVGTPPHAAMEATRLGPVLPTYSNFNLGIPLVSLGGRGLAANLTLYYNS